MRLLHFLTAVVCLAFGVSACKPSGVSVLTADGPKPADANVGLNLDQNGRLKITPVAPAKIASVKALSTAGVVSGTVTPRKAAFVPLSSPTTKPRFLLELGLTSGNVLKTCSSSTTGVALTGNIGLACYSQSDRIKALKETCFKLERESSLIASFPDNDEYCSCKKHRDQKLAYAPFLSHPVAVFEAACRSAAATPKDVCADVVNSCPTGKECFAGEQLCQCGETRLRYDNERYKNDLVALRLDCLAALGTLTPAANTAAAPPANSLAGVPEPPNATESELNSVNSNVGLKRAAVIRACDEAIAASYASKRDETHCHCLNEALKFDDYLDDLDHFAYSCRGD